MDAGALYQLHNAGDEHIPAVADGVDLHFPAFNILIDQHGLVLVDFHGGAQVVTQLVLVGHNLHGPASQHKAGPDQHGVADLRGGGNAVLDLGHGLALGPGNVQLVQEVFKLVPVLGPVDGGAVGADDCYAPLHQGVCQVDGGLAAQGGDDTLGILEVQDVHDVLRGQRLEIQLVRSGVVGGDGLRVVVDDDGLVALTADGIHGVDGGVVKFHALADADGAGTQDHDLLLVGEPGVGGAGIGGVEVGDIGPGVAGVYHAEGREQILLAAQGIDIQLLPLPQLGNELIAEAHDLGFLQHLHAAYIGGELLLHGHDLADGLDEVGRDLGHGVDAVNGDLPAQQLCYGEDGVVPELLQVFQDLLGLHVGKLGHVEVAHADFQRTDGL